MNPVRETARTLISPHPHECCLCREEAPLGEDGLCDLCRKNLRLSVNPAPLFPLDGLTAGLNYDEKVAHAFYRFKKKEQTWLAAFFAQYMSIPEEWHAEIIVPVPLHPFKEWLRTYNQSFLLSEYLSSRYGLPICRPLLSRVKWTPAQKKKTASERKRGMKRVFKADPAAKGRIIVLVDDVTTTGSTLAACAAALKKAGALRVYAACASSVNR